MTLFLPLAACQNPQTATSGTATPEFIGVLVHEAGEEVGEWTGDGDDFPDHPHVPEDVEISVAHPVFEGADAFSEALARHVDQEVMDFRGVSRDPVSLEITWEVVAASDDVLGVRLVRTEEDLHGVRQGYATYWYDVSTGHTGYATELLADDAALAELNGLAGEVLKDHPDVDHQGLLPVMRTYDSMGFNEDGDLVVEFDDGHLSPVVEGHPPDASKGRITAIVPSDLATPLLSELGERAREASLTEEPVLSVSEPDAPSDAVPVAPGVVTDPGPDVDCADPGVKCVALTFDDGPVEQTAHLLDILAEEEVTASFFLNGGPLLTRPWSVRRMYAEGHELANHNDLHESMSRHFEPEELPAQVAMVSAGIRRQTGHTVDLFRPPFGATNADVKAEISAQDMAEIMWTVDSEDWTGSDRDEIVEKVVSEVEPNGVVLLHDPQPPTIAAVPGIIEQLREQGYVFVTTTQALAPETGKTYPPDWDGSW
ncbi:polysaccharide deacetylase family protein [Nocardiopsis lambiniae]|uniref:Polysaccharide deacetylase family protein n=1 Tax=Nocardiopsis lambiniae TaxID=3075539 RepID=A0ABU2M3W8_9ACTN|nr:polysaccharide deacetylase family protein [Nocardiopsis sp. DSM 44743]MDT0327332.1 polysaccharide deacetylase family protein [Nocardiopsis sp. DSM 44743]